MSPSIANEIDNMMPSKQQLDITGLLSTLTFQFSELKGQIL